MTKAEIIKKAMEEVLNGRFLQIDDCKQITTMIITPEELQKILEEVLPEDEIPPEFERLRNAVKEAMPCMEERVDREKRFKEQYEGQTFDFGSGKLKFYAAPNDCINIRGIPEDEAWFFMNGKIAGIFKFKGKDENKG